MSPRSIKTLLPVPNRLESFWLTERDVELKDARTTPDLPSSADVVIVGSGLSGAMMAYNLQLEGERRGRIPSIVMLEADEVCGGATARNGGHCKPFTYNGFRADAAKHGAQVADQLMRFEAEALGQYADIVAKENIDCDLHVTRAFDVCMTKAGAEESHKDFIARQKDFPESVRQGDLRSVEDPKELARLTGIKEGYWGASYPAGHLWPYKLATALIRIAIGKGMNLQTYTPAISLEKQALGWQITTARGIIAAGSVVIATNAYTSSLLPEFKPKIIPVRGTVCSITPAPSYSAGSTPGPLRYTYGIRFGTGESDYMISRQGRGRTPGKGDHSIILGGAKGCFLKDLDQWYDNKYDNEEMPGARKYFEEYMGKHFVGWNGNERGNVDHVWSGVLGYSNDMLPYIGEHPDRPRVFICAGFTGHGMPRIPGCTKVLSSLMLAADRRLGQRAFERGIPKPYWVTKERLSKDINLIKGAMGQSKKTEQEEGSNFVQQIARAKL